MIKNILPYLVALCASPIASGCGNPAPSKVESADEMSQRVAADKQFLSQINALPPDQRTAFIQSHFPEYRGLMSDPDPTIREGFAQLTKHP